MIDVLVKVARLKSKIRMFASGEQVRALAGSWPVNASWHMGTTRHFKRLVCSVHRFLSSYNRFHG